MSAAGQSKADLIAALKMALRIAEDGAGTMPAKEAVKLRPRDWHKIADLIRALASEPEPQPVAGWQWREWHETEDAWGPWQYGRAPAWLREEGERFEQRALFAASPHQAETAPDQEGQTDGR